MILCLVLSIFCTVLFGYCIISVSIDGNWNKYCEVKIQQNPLTLITNHIIAVSYEGTSTAVCRTKQDVGEIFWMQSEFYLTLVKMWRYSWTDSVRMSENVHLPPTTASTDSSLNDPFKVKLLKISCAEMNSSSGREPSFLSGRRRHPHSSVFFKIIKITFKSLSGNYARSSI